MATRADVAKLAGVSPSTVSYVLSGARSISDETRKRVNSAVKELNYRPNHAAVSLAGGKSRVIALVSPSGKEGMSPSFVEYIYGVFLGAHEHGYHVMIYSENDISLREISDLHKSGVLDGLLLMEIELKDKRVSFLKNHNIPFVMIGRNAEPKELNFVDRDFQTDGVTAVEYLSSLGHKCVALVRVGRDRTKAETGADWRFSEIIRQECKNRGITLWEKFADNNAHDGRETFIEIREKHPAVTAILTLGDLLTIALVNAAREFGVKVPEDLSILALAMPDTGIEMSWPPLSTISIRDEEIGKAAANILICQLKGEPKEANQRLWAGELHVRGTTGPRI